MTDTAGKFKKKPRQKASRGKSIAISPEERQKYEELIREKTERDASYTRHLPHPDNKPRR